MNKKQENLPSESKPENAEQTNRKNVLIFRLVLISLAILLPVVVYFVKQNQLTKQKTAYEERITGLEKFAADRITAVEQQHLAVIAKVFSWLAVNELSRNNSAQIEKDMLGLVKEDGYMKISLLNVSGVVVMSTDKKYEGQGYSGPLAGEMLNLGETKSATQADGSLLLLSPMFVGGLRAGTMVISYQPVKIEFPSNPKNSN